MPGGFRDDAQLRQLFESARAFPPGDERDDFLIRQCGDNAHLRQRIEGLLTTLEDSTNDGTLLASALERLAPLAKSVTQSLNHQVQDEISFAATGSGNAKLDAQKLTSCGPYKIIERIGEGGMGSVYRGRQNKPIEREVAIKLIKPGMLSHEVISRFQLEQQAVAKMQHPNIAQIFDAGETETAQPYFVMELVRGTAIDVHCSEQALPLEARLRLIQRVCAGVQHAHENGILHRDIKPGNILVSSVDGAPLPKLIDFGIAKSIGTESVDQTQFTHFSQLIGTPVYMSPEMVSFDKTQLDARSDIYALGAVLYELVTGQPPFDRKYMREAGQGQMRKIILHDVPQRPSRKVRSSTQNERQHPFSSREIANDLDWIILKCLEKDPAKRYVSASELAQDIDRFLNGQRTSVAQSSTIYHLKSLVRRNSFGIVATAISLGVFGVVASLWLSYLAEKDAKARLDQEVRDSKSKMILEQQATYDTLEAAALQSLVGHFRDRNLTLAHEVIRPASPVSEAAADENRQNSAQPATLVDRLFNCANPTPAKSMQHPAPVRDMCVCDEGNSVWTVCEDGWIRKWNLETGTIVKKFGPHSHPAQALALSPDESRIASGDKDGSMIIWDTETETQIAKSAPRETGIESLAWSPDGRHIAAGVRYEHVEIFDSSNAKSRHVFDNGGRGTRYESLLFRNDGNQLFTSSIDLGIDIFDMSTFTRARNISIEPYQAPVRTMCLLGEQQDVLLSCDQQQYRFFLTAFSNPLETWSVDVTLPITQDFAYAQESGSLAAAELNGTVTLYQFIEPTESTPPSIEKLIEFPTGDGAEAVTSVRFLRGDHLLTASASGAVRLWNRHELQPLQVKHLPDCWGSLSVDKDHFLTVREHRNDSNQFSVELRSFIRPMAVSKKFTIPKELLSVEGRIPLHRMAKVESLAPAGTPGQLGIKTHSPILAVANDKTIRIISLEDASKIAELQTKQQVQTLEWSPATRRLVAISKNQTHIWRCDVGYKNWTPEGEWSSQTANARAFFTNNGEIVISGEFEPHIENHVLRRRKAISGQLENEMVAQGLKTFCLSEDCKHIGIATASKLRVVEMRDDRTIFAASEPGQGVTLQLFDNARMLLALTSNATIKLWHTPTNTRLGVLFEPKDYGMADPRTAKTLRFLATDHQGHFILQNDMGNTVWLEIGR